MSILGSLLKNLGYCRPITDDERSQAEVDDELFNHRKALERLSEATQLRRASNARFKAALEDAQAHSNVFKERASDMMKIRAERKINQH